MAKKIVTILIGLLICSQALWADDGQAGQVFPFLRYGIGTRALGLGKAYTALADDPIGIFWNPAGSARPSLQTWQLTVGYDQLFFDDSKLMYAAGFYPLMKIGTFGLYFAGFNNGDFSGRDINNLPTADFSLSQNMLGFSYAYAAPNFSVIKGLSAGLFLKSLSNKIGSTTNSAFDMDLGLKWKLSFLKGLDFAFAYRNLLKAKAGEDENVTTMVMGLCYVPIKNLTALADFYMPSEGETDVRLGLEYKVSALGDNFPLFIRGGYCQSEITLGAAMGFRLPGEMTTQLDYAFTNQSEIESNSSKFSLSLYGKSIPCDVRWRNLIGDPLEANRMRYKGLVGKFNKAADDLNNMTTLCANGIYGGLATIMLGNLDVEAGNWSGAIANYQAGFEMIKSIAPLSAILPFSPTYADVNGAVRYETHCNYAESYLHQKEYAKGSAALAPLQAVNTYIDPEVVDTPATKYKYRFLYDLALLKIGEKDYMAAVGYLNQIETTPRDSMNVEIALLALIRKAECLIELKQYSDAEQALGFVGDFSVQMPGFIDEFPNIEPFGSSDRLIMDDKLYLEGLALAGLGNQDEAKAKMREIVYQFPFSDSYNKAIQFLVQ